MQVNLLLTSECIDWATTENKKAKVYYDDLINGPHGPLILSISTSIGTTDPRQLIWHVINEQLSTPTCMCDSPRKWVKNLRSYRQTCGPVCAGKIKSAIHPKKIKDKKDPYYTDPNRLASALETRKRNSLAKYGVESPTSLPEVTQKRKQTNLKKYGTEFAAQNTEVRKKISASFKKAHQIGSDDYNNLIDKRKKTSLERYGVEHPMQSATVKDKQQDTTNERYGVRHALQSTELNAKRRQTNLVKFGVNEAIASNQIRQQIDKSNLEKYGEVNWTHTTYSEYAKEILFNTELFEHTFTGKTLNESKDLIGVSLRTILNYASRYNLRHIFSDVKITGIENKVNNFLTDYLGTNFKRNVKSIIPPQELDFYIPTKNIAIELNGVYWHSELGGGHRGKNYHKNKWQECCEKGITLLQFTSLDIENRWHLVESKIKRHLSIQVPVIGARKLEIKKITAKSVENEFLEKWHLQGPTVNRQLALGAYYQNTLVGITTWNVSGSDAELVRFATNVNFSYPGLLSKMIKYFLKETKFQGKLLSYSSNNHSNGQLYKSCGFILDGVTPPGYMYTKNYLQLESRLKYQKHKLKKRFNLSDSDLTSKSEWEIMQDNGYDRLWDSGNTRWVKML